MRGRRSASARMPPCLGGLRPGPERELDAGDRLRIVVYGQEGLTNAYAIDAGGSITMPLIGLGAGARTDPGGTCRRDHRRLRSGYIRDPSVGGRDRSYRPFFILGEVAAPGQYPYVPT